MHVTESMSENSGSALNILKCITSMDGRGAGLPTLWQHRLAVCHLHRALPIRSLGKSIERAEVISRRLAALACKLKADIHRVTLELWVLEHSLV